MSQDYINVLAPTVELTLPECWSLAGGSAPGEDCAWFTAALNPRAPVLLSRTELGSPNGEAFHPRSNRPGLLKTSEAEKMRATLMAG